MECVRDVQNLSQREKNSILHVLQRDEKLRKGQEEKIAKLKQEIHTIRMCSVLRAGDEQNKMCLRCRQEFGIVFNRGALCPSCRFKVCKQCQEVMFNGSWLCKLCYKQRQLKWLSGEWAASFEQNPLRKWASGSDLVKTSLQMLPGSTTIDIDEPPPQHNQSTNKGRKVSRNGVHGQEQDRTRVEVPKEGDQLKLSELFNVLRVKKPQDKAPQETQVRRVTSRRYSESDSDSSSNSDIEVRSSSTAFSVTESEIDTRRLESPGIIESPTPPIIIESPPQEFDAPDGHVHFKQDSQTHLNDRERDTGRPIPSPRSPKPAKRSKVRSDHIEKETTVPVARPRSPRPRPQGSDSRVVGSRPENTVPDIDNVHESSSIHSNLSAHVARTKESLEVKREVEKSKSQNSLNANCADEMVVRPKIRDYDKHRKSSENAIKDESSDRNGLHSEHYRKTDGQLDKNMHQTERQGTPRRSRENVDRDSSNQNFKKHHDSEEVNAITGDNDQSNIGDELLIPRTGSPYSFSMDSLPSSHPSPTLRRTSFTSQPESSDNDSGSKHSHGDISENSRTETVVKEGSEEEFVVEELSQVRFRRMSKGLGQMAVISKMNKSPNKNETGEVGVEQEETQSRGTYGNFEERGGAFKKELDDNVQERGKNFNQRGMHGELNDNVFYEKEDDINEIVNEEVIVKGEKAGSLTATNNLTEALMKKLQAISNRSGSETKSPSDLSWFSEFTNADQNDGRNIKSKNLPRHLTSSVISDTVRYPSETDSMEGMIDDMFVESTKKLRPTESDLDTGSCLTPITPLTGDFYGGKSEDYRLAYISDDNLESDVFEDDTSNILRGSTENEMDSAKLSAKKKALKAMSSLDRLLSDQGDLVDEDETDAGLEKEFQNALRYSAEDDEELLEIFGTGEKKVNESKEKEKDSPMTDLRTEKSRNSNKQIPTIEVITASHENQIQSAPIVVNVQKQESPTKQKLQAQSSLDVLIDKQGAFIDSDTQNVEFDQELLESLEKQFKDSIKRRKDSEDLKKEYAYLGMPHNVENVQNSSRDEPDGKHLDDGFNKLVNESESFLEVETVKQTAKEPEVNQQVNMKEHVTRMGIVVQDRMSTSSSDSDMLSVIEEVENELSDSDTKFTTPEKKQMSESESKIPSQFSKSESKIPEHKEAPTEKPGKLSDMDSSNTKPGKLLRVQGNIFEKVKYLEKNEKESNKGSGSAWKIKQRDTDVKTQEKYKKLHDMWHAVEKHEADILDFEHDDSDKEITEEIAPISKETTEAIAPISKQESDMPENLTDENIKPDYTDNDVNEMSTPTKAFDDHMRILNNTTDDGDSIVPLIIESSYIHENVNDSQNSTISDVSGTHGHYEPDVLKTSGNTETSYGLHGETSDALTQHERYFCSSINEKNPLCHSIAPNRRNQKEFNDAPIDNNNLLVISPLKNRSYQCGSINDSSYLCHSIGSDKGHQSAGYEDVDAINSHQALNVSAEPVVHPVPEINVQRASTVRKTIDVRDHNEDTDILRKSWGTGSCKSISDGEEPHSPSAAEEVNLRKKNSISVFRGTCESIADDVDCDVEGLLELPERLEKGHVALALCRTISDGESSVFYQAPEDSEICNSIDETVMRRPLFETIEEEKNVTEAHDKSTDKTHKPLARLSGIKGKADLTEVTSKTVFTSHMEMVLDHRSKITPPADSEAHFFKEPPIRPPRSKKVTVPFSSQVSISSDPTPSSLPIGEMDSPRSEKLPSSRVESPQTISECSGSQDDSGHVSGGSRGTTPEHKRTDSNYSQSSIPSTLSTVTDDTDEDIDKVVANVQQNKRQLGSRGNLLSVFGDSRESIASYYSDAGDIAYSNVPVTGEILFSLNYNYKTSMLEVGVKNCRDIAIADTRRNRTDPYVKTYLLPDRTRGGKRKTKVKKHATSPTFDETLKYSITKSELENRTLWVTVWHNDRFGRNIFLGEVTINFDYHKFDDPFPRWYPLQERMDTQPSSMMVYKGDVSVCIRYVPADKINPSSSSGKGKKDSSKGQLQVMVKEARNLTGVKSNGFSDPFCKGYLLPERHKNSKQKTVVIKKECNPVWNHTFTFEDVTLMELRERCLELTIWDYEKLTSNDFLGGVRLNLGTGVSQGKAIDWMDARGEEMSMWQAMLDRPNFWIDGALILRPNMDKRKY